MGQETVTIKIGVHELYVTGHYSKGEEMVMYYPDGSGHPGSASEFEPEKVEYTKGDLTVDIMDIIDEFNTWFPTKGQDGKMILTDDLNEHIINLVIEKIEE